MKKNIDDYASMYRSNDTSPWEHAKPSHIDWYKRQHMLEPGMAFTNYEGSIVRLYQPVPGDGTQWFVEDYDASRKSWFYYASTIEPGDLVKRMEHLDE